MRYISPLLAVFFLTVFPCQGQKFEWGAGFNGFFDNREYYSLDIPKTMFGARASGMVGVSLTGGHRIMAGIDYLYEFGHRPDAYLPDVTLFYQYESAKVDFIFGAFPRSGYLQYPIALLSDTLNYYRPNVQGAYFLYRGGWGYENVFIDWTSRQTDTAPEHFIYGFSGKFQKSLLFLEHYFLMGHFAAKGIPDPGYHLRDNGGFQVNLGADLSSLVFLDSLSLFAGGLVSLDRIRGVDDTWQTPAGFTAGFTVLYRFLGIDGTCYSGQGHTFLYGDPFYRLKQYGRLDIYFIPFRSGKVNVKLDMGIHFTPSQVDYSQQIRVTVNLPR